MEDAKNFKDILLKGIPDTIDPDNYVVLKEDGAGRYIEYAFRDGAPENNRCLSWYDSMQPGVLKKNGHDPGTWKIKEAGKIYRLGRFTCGEDDNPDPELRCRVGRPSPRCLAYGRVWNPEEPCKCACWCLEEVGEKITIPVTVRTEDLFEWFRDNKK